MQLPVTVLLCCPVVTVFAHVTVLAFYYQLHSLLFHHVHYYHMYMLCWKASAI